MQMKRISTTIPAEIKDKLDELPRSFNLSAEICKVIEKEHVEYFKELRERLEVLDKK